MKKNILITGGTSGIGFNAAKTLVKKPENNLILIGKNIDKGELAIEKLKEMYAPNMKGGRKRRRKRTRKRRKSRRKKR